MKNLNFYFGFFRHFWPKLTKDDENYQNPNRLVKISEIWNAGASQQKKIKNPIVGIFWPLLAKNSKKRPNLKKIVKIQTI